MNHAQRYLAFDLFTGQIDHLNPSWPWLRKNGVTEQDLDWFKNRSAKIDILGVNFYPWSGGEYVKNAKGEPTRTNLLSGQHLACVLREAWDRYKVPLMVTETGSVSDVTGRTQWMDDTISAVRTMQAEGIPIRGYTWFALIPLIDWAYRTGTKPLKEYVRQMGLWDGKFDELGTLRRVPTPLIGHYREFIQGER